MKSLKNHTITLNTIRNIDNSNKGKQKKTWQTYKDNLKGENYYLVKFLVDLFYKWKNNTYVYIEGIT
jgi:hypothetical protein